MPNRNRASELVSEPTLVTKWEEFTVEGGILFVRYWCGPVAHCVAMGPTMAFEAIDRARRALSQGVVERLLGDGPGH